jgi:hypothetical protein
LNGVQCGISAGIAGLATAWCTPVNYVRLPPSRGERRHVKLVAVLLACAFSACVVETARSYRHPAVRERVHHARHAP